MDTEQCQVELRNKNRHPAVMTCRGYLNRQWFHLMAGENAYAILYTSWNTRDEVIRKFFQQREQNPSRYGPKFREHEHVRTLFEDRLGDVLCSSSSTRAYIPCGDAHG